MQQVKTQLRDKVIEQLLGILRPFQIVALNRGDVEYNNGDLFLRVRCEERGVNEYLFISMPAQVQTDLEVFLADGLPLYEKRSEALFPNKFGEYQSIRNLRYRHQREYGIKREIVKIGKPAGIDGIQWFNLWSRAEVIYFALAEAKQQIKIGHTRSFSQRFLNLESLEGQLKLLGLMEGNRNDEARILNQFRHLCIRGSEWFRPAKELLDFIDQANTAGRRVFEI